MHGHAPNADATFMKEKLLAGLKTGRFARVAGILFLLRINLFHSINTFINEKKF
jgi:hypothetical protein